MSEGNAEAGSSKLPIPAKKPPAPERPFWWRFVGFDTTADILSWRPGRKSGLFLLVASTVSAAVYYDRSEATRIRRDYQDRVRHYAEAAVSTEELPRKITVLSTRLPDDPTEDRAVTWFKVNVKPILYAAGIDYSIIHGAQPGALARKLVSRFREKRLAALDRELAAPLPGQSGFTRSVEEARELIDGGIITVGRSALKEYLWALKQGFLTDLDLERAQRVMAIGSSEEQVFEEELGQELAEDGFFERALEGSKSATETDGNSAFSPGIYSSVLGKAERLSTAPSAPSRILPALSSLPPQPPLLNIAYGHPLGSMFWWPKKLYNWLFDSRSSARQGAEAALRVIENHTRPLIHPPGPLDSEHGIYIDDVEQLRVWLNEKRKIRRDVAHLWRANPTGSPDLDAGLRNELYYDKAFRKWPANIAQARAVYEKELVPRIVKAREEGGAAEASLRAERLEKENRWRHNVDGWRITRPGSGITWDQGAFAESLRVFVDAEDDQS